MDILLKKVIAYHAKTKPTIWPTRNKSNVENAKMSSKIYGSANSYLRNMPTATIVIPWDYYKRD